MRITASQLDMNAQVSERRHETESAHVEAWVGERPTYTAGALVGLSGEARRMAQGSRISSAPPPEAKNASAVNDPAGAVEDVLDPKLRLLVALVKRLSGRRVELVDTRELTNAADSAAASESEAAVAVDPAAAASPEFRSAGWGLEIQSTRTVVEQQSLSFAAQGVVVTGDGRRLAFETTLAMEHEKVTVESFELRVGDAAAPKDPLALNFVSGGAQFFGARAPIDLDGDGQAEAIPLLTRESALLMHDANGNSKDPGRNWFASFARTIRSVQAVPRPM
jgi:hypothetical protein